MMIKQVNRRSIAGQSQWVENIVLCTKYIARSQNAAQSKSHWLLRCQDVFTIELLKFGQIFSIVRISFFFALI